MFVRLIAAAIAGGIAFFALGFLIYGLLLDPYMKANTIVYPGLIKETPDFPWLVLANVVNAFLFAYIFDQWAGIRSFIGGLKGGAILMFLFALSMDLQFVAFMNMWKGNPLVPIIVDILAAAILGALAGGVIGFVLGKMGGGADAAPEGA